MVTLKATLHELPGIGISWVSDERMQRASHAVSDGRGRLWLIDPVDWEPGIAAAIEHGEVAGVIQLFDRHNRDGAELSERLGVPHYRFCDPPVDRPVPLPQGFDLVPIPIVSRRGWREVALFDPERGVLVVAESIGTSPLYAVGTGRAGVHPLARLKPPGSFERLRALAPESLLVGHGAPLASGASHDLHQAIECARRDIPRLVVSLPALVGDR